MKSNRKILHIDMDAFYASVEQKDNPTLKGKPVIVGGRPDSRGVVAACSYEARAYGIHSAMPCARAYKLCPHAAFIRPRMDRYREISTIVMSIFHRFTDIIEPLSLDEAYLDITENKISEQSATIVAKQICRMIFDETGLTASAGVSCNKFVAKIASDLNKPNGISIIRPDEIPAFLARLPVGKFHGVGKVTEKKMILLGIRNGADLKDRSRQELIEHFGKHGLFYYNIVRGKDDREVRPSRTRKSIGAERTFKEDIDNIDDVIDLLQSISARVGTTLLEKKCSGRTITLKVRYSDFTTITRSFTSRTALTCHADIFRHVPRLLDATEAGYRKIRLLGISVSNLTHMEKKGPRQLKLPFH